MESTNTKNININNQTAKNLLQNSKTTSKKRQRDEENIDDIIQDPDKNLSKSFNNINFSEESDGFISDSNSDEELIIDQDHDDNSDEYMEEDINTNKSNKIEIDEDYSLEKNNKVTLWDDKKLPEDGMELDFDNEAYEMLHRARVEWPCMSIDFILNENTYLDNTANKFNVPSIYNNYKTIVSNKKTDKYPYSCYMVAGSQTSTQNSFLYCMKWSNMQKTLHDDDPDREADSDEEEGQDPFMKYEKVQIKGNINRVRSMKNSYLCALWSDSPAVEIVDIRSILSDLEYTSSNSKKRKLNTKNVILKSFQRNQEGFGLNWANHLPGVLAAGGQDKKIEVYYPVDENFSDWILTSNNSYGYKDTLKGHKGSIEDISWSPVQGYVLGSCSTDRSIRFWDLRNNNTNSTILIENAHTSDVNCLSWNNFSEFLVASGGDDGSFKVWDIRYINNGPITNIQWHKGPITSIQWDNFDDTQIAVASEDNKVSIWDFSVEPDDNQLFDNNNKEVPQQLVFLHQGQENIKDIKFHPIFKNLITATAESGINVFKPAFEDNDSIGSDDDEIEKF